MVVRLVAVALVSACVASATNVTCDIVVAGGSTASLAAALTAAEAAPDLVVCFTEFTDWPGGQMSAGGVPAIDYGGSNRKACNQPRSFRDAMDSIPGDKHLHNTTEGSGSPGACSVSTTCYLPNAWVQDWVMPRLGRSSNLRVFLRTAVVATRRDESGRIVALDAVRRRPRAGGRPEWSRRLSEELHDWYTPTDSSDFSKEVLTLTGKVFIEATELGDVLATSGLPFAQGIEVPHENSTALESGCGQAATLTFYMELLDSAPAMPDPAPAGGAAGGGWPDPQSFADGGGWRHSWSWRRSFCAGNTSLFASNVGDITQQNLGNDLDTAYCLLNLEDTRAEAAKGWRGGLNLTALRMLEDRAYGWFHYMKNVSKLVDPSYESRLVINRTTSGTSHGLSKMVYWRDTRRAASAFRLMHTELRDTSGATGVHFFDSVALGEYNDDTHHLSSCSYPDYMNGRGEGAKPYYIPFRALMVDGAPNLLAAGKSMSQTFHANSNTRLHPSEWTSGVAAGGAAVLMARNGWSSADALANIAQVRAYLNSSSVGQPLDWTGLSPMPTPVGSACELGRCISVDANAAKMSKNFHNGSFTCGASPSPPQGCSLLGSDEWLANKDFWSAPDQGAIIASQNTVLKKSTAYSAVLPPDQLLAADVGTKCELIAPEAFAGYFLCRVNASSS